MAGCNYAVSVTPTEAIDCASLNVYSGTGGETTATAMCWLVLAMVWHPEVQRKAQAQLDAVVGRDRMPVRTMYFNFHSRYHHAHWAS